MAQLFSISALTAEILSGKRISDEEAYRLFDYVENGQEAYRKEFYECAHRITRHFNGTRFDTCSIINCKSGNCPEDCKWCAQSAHYKTSAEAYALLPDKPSVDLALHNRRSGISRFSLVGSGKRASDREIEKLSATFRAIAKATDIKCCASLGLLREEQLAKLYQAGVRTYHCNMETAPSFFPLLCTTHTQRDKIETIEAARRVGMRVCSGGIIGMGESARQRVEFALFLRSLKIESIPINILQPIEGTPLAKAAPLSPDEIFSTIAYFRFIHPTAYLRFSGGRRQLSDQEQQWAIYIGINAAITGDMLTTDGEQVAHDMEMIERAGMRNEWDYEWER